MTIYIVTSFDDEFNSAGHSARIMKAFDSESKAHEFMADCGYELEQWEDAAPELLFYGTDKQIAAQAKKFDKHAAKHPFRFDDGYMATGFMCEAIEVE